MDGRIVRAIPQKRPKRFSHQITGDRMSNLHEFHGYLFGALTKEENLIFAISALAGVLLIGAVIIAKVDRWRKRQMTDSDDTPGYLGSFREMYEQGEISKEEYDRVLKRMAERALSKQSPVKSVGQPTASADEKPNPPTE
jgi:uncharacterized membrane protein